MDNNIFFKNESVSLYHQDCLEIMKTWEDNVIDTVITDPPYFLMLMGRKWDCSLPKIEIWKEMLRVSKPGAILMAFGHTRTYHRLACLIEDAGWELIDTISWMYGCLSEDTEILTTNGWKRYNKNICKHLVLCFNVNKKSFEFHKPKRSFIYENKHTAYRIQSDNTDQIVSRNHRVLVEQKGKLLFSIAEEVAQEQKANIPFLESLSDLPETIPNLYSGTSIKKQDLLKRVCHSSNDETKAREANRRAKGNLNQVCCLWKRSLENECLVKKSKVSYLFHALQWYFKRSGVEKMWAYGKVSLETRKRNKIQKENDWQEKPCLERRDGLSSQTRQLCSNKIYKVSKRIFTYGQKRWVHSRASFNYGKIYEKMLNKNGSSSSHQPQSCRQQNKKSSIIQDKQRTQTIRSTRAKITPIEYKGKVWCVEVPTGAFIARRNGKIFITGNSGMPKGLNISNALKKIAKKENISLEEEINKWNGWATTLKPSWEPITIAMKPCEGGFVDNALKWGVCGFNIDECRIELQKEGEDPRLGGNGSWKTDRGMKKVYGGGLAGNEITSSPKGRFPSNTILTHHPECKMIGLKKVKSDAHYSYPDSKGVLNFGFKKMEDQGNPHTGEDGLETVEEWSCHPDCPVKILDDQSGILKSGNNCVRRRVGTFLEHGSLGKSGDVQTTYGDVGTASRFFYCAKADSDDRFFYCTICKDAYPRTKEKEHMHDHPEGDIKHLIYHPSVKPQGILKFLAKLTKTPTGGTILDPFMGSGSMALACISENRKFIGCDMEETYCKISKKRVESLVEEKGTLFN